MVLVSSMDLIINRFDFVYLLENKIEGKGSVYVELGRLCIMSVRN